VRVNVFEKLPTPYGLVRAGVAPDHQNTKGVIRLFDGSAAAEGFTFYLNVEVGTHVMHAELLAHHHAVLYAVGAPDDRRLDIEGWRCPVPAPRPRPSHGSTAIPTSRSCPSTSATRGWW
jgi:ferredoxin--NADP+ reductase